VIIAPEELDNIQAKDELKPINDGKWVLLSDYLRKRKSKNV
jgi:hypothetical protein